MRSLYIFLLTFLFIPHTSNAMPSPKPYDPYQYLTVSADAEIKVQPNRLSLVFGINHRDPILNDGKNKMRSIIKNAISFAKKNGIKDKSIQTDEIRIHPEYENRYGDPSRKIIYYEFVQTFAVTLEDLTKYEDILYGLLGLGINVVNNVELYSTEMLKYRNQARTNAIKAAKDKAQLLADETGIKLGKIVNIQENPYNRYYGLPRFGSNMSQNINQIQGSGIEETGNLSLGLIPIGTSVTLIYEVIH